MKKVTYALLALALLSGGISTAQSADEILATYFENTGGEQQWKALSGMKMSAKINQQGMEIPLEIYQFRDGKQMTVVKFQGKEIKQGVFDGETLWSTNFMTMQPEKGDAETLANLKLDSNDFPDPFLDYKDKGYTVELMGKETMEGAETYKVKLVREPITVDGQTKENVSYYYFDTENFVPIAVESEVHAGPMKGQTQLITFSDYQEVGGLYFPFSMSQGIKGGASQPITMEQIELNPDLDTSVFAFPEQMGGENKQ
jgi:hypothetical protein